MQPMTPAEVARRLIEDRARKNKRYATELKRIDNSKQWNPYLGETL